ncbi:hypothetical protein SAMD00019534_103800 [Acytostelium subglobosum LB1]|uniref:hypothetical protein n=1 Tax=Acytostelium subglobosum LB1 TaxID=1410327 RepID=UPI000644A1A5|nr:hypothetical protein SAMD00019534_103800 [Acytostelium subglobosum LB1]GAM27205.1 hypothetical protein SAMD00019534_103800 [Acytostelium subglobosum LB1]|eukprot:XP_012749672.1 hypothetical protein SAMD00019534_103800 [Acytostelium subglobosum LB1]
MEIKTVDLIIQAKWIIPVVPQYTVYKDHSLVVHNGLILDIVRTSDVPLKYYATENKVLDTADATDCHILIPGLFNMHAHSAMALFRAYADDVSLHDWLTKFIWPAEAQYVNRDSVKLGTELACLEMLKTGTTYFNEMYYHPESALEVVDKCGMRATVAVPIIKFPTSYAATEAEYIDKGEVLIEQYKGHDRIKMSLGPHAVYTITDEAYLRVKKLSEQHGLVIHTHLHETHREVEDEVVASGMRPIDRLEQLGVLSDKLVAVHMTHLTPQEIDLIEKRKVNVVHCPESNLKLGVAGICPVHALVNKGVNVSIGTDSAASNDDLDMLGELRCAAYVDKLCFNIALQSNGESTDKSVTKAAHILSMATINGAKALGVDKHLGSLELGKKADIVAVKATSHPIYDPISHLVYVGTNKIQVVPTSKDFVDIVLSKTQRKTPTEIHKQYAIGRIRTFYMRKVKYTQQSYHDKLSQIIQDFPLLDDIHPFYSDLVNVLYDKDHYKLALGQLNTARNLIDNIAKDYLRLLKYGDSLYRCKQLKRAALGRMCTLMLRQNSSLQYLEQVRQHLARLPSIDPNTRTILLCGYPNVGKSSFMNKLTRANVDVQPYAFTTKSLFVGHTDYKYAVWQVIDTPGILDHPLEERNTIEMQSITALAHLHSCVLYIIDISERCGYTIKQQVDLFYSIKALFLNKPLIVVVNKIDVKKPEDVAQEDWELIQSLADPATGGIGGTKILPMSTLTEEGVANVKDVACTTLLEERVEKKLKSSKIQKDIHRLHLAMPKPRDNKVRPAIIPPSVLAFREAMQDAVEDEKKIKLTSAQMEVLQEEEDDLKFQQGILPMFDINEWKRKYQLKDDSWKFDIIPEIMDGQNIADFIDPEILEKLEELEREEEALLEELKNQMNDEEESDIDEEDQELYDEIQEKKFALRMDHVINDSSKPKLPKNVLGLNTKDMSRNLRSMGVDREEVDDIISDVRSKSRSKSRGRKRDRSEEREESVERGVSLNRSQSRSRSRTPAPLPGEGFRDLAHKLMAEKLNVEARKKRNRLGLKGEADHHVFDEMPKHLFAGKRKAGKTTRR